MTKKKDGKKKRQRQKHKELEILKMESLKEAQRDK